MGTTFKLKIINKNGASTIQQVQVNSESTEIFEIVRLVKKSRRVKDVKILEE